MKKLLLKLLGETVMKKVKKWLSENGFMGFVALAVAAGALFFGMMWLFWAAIGGFVGKNWQIIVNLWEDKYKDMAEDLVDKAKDKIGN